MKVIKKYSVYVDNVHVNVSVVDAGGYTAEYRISLPKISTATAALLDSIKEELLKESKIGAEEIFDPVRIKKLISEFETKAETLIAQKLPTISAGAKNFLTASLVEEMLGLGTLEILLADDDLEEIVINTSKEPVWVYHREFGWLKTNIFIDSEQRIKNYASIIGRRVGRQITVLEPLLDAHLITGDRANATLFPVSTKGNTLSIRKFARKPWTIADFISNKTMNMNVASFFWQCIQYELNMIVAGGTSSGKTALLNTLMPFIQPNHRIISIEDSVTGDTEIIVKRGNKLEIKKIEDIVSELTNNDADFDGGIKPHNDMKVLSLDSGLRIKSCKPSAFYRHKVKKNIYKITTSTGRKISVTEDHSLFTLGENGCLKETTPKDMECGNVIATPRTIPYEGEDVKHVNLAGRLDIFGGFVIGKPLERIFLAVKNDDFEKYGINKKIFRYWRKKNIIPSKLFSSVSEDKKISFTDGELKEMKLKLRNGRPFPIIFELTDDILCMFGMWLGDGSYDYRNENRVIITSTEKECIDVVKRVAQNLGINLCAMNDKASFSLNSTALYRLMRHFGLDGYSDTKTIPNFIFNLSNRQMSQFMRGYFSADGTVKSNEVSCSSQSMELLNVLQTMLLRFGIISRISDSPRKDKCFELRISSNENITKFSDRIGFLQGRKMEKLQNLRLLKASHTTSDIVPIKGVAGNSLRIIKPVSAWYFGKWNMGREHLQSIVDDAEDDSEDIELLRNLAHSDVYWDKITKIEKTGAKESYVYDISVPGLEKFVANNFIVHNTRELQLPNFMHWVPLTTRLPNPEGKGEINMLDLMINSLRMRPDRMVVGEIRRAEQAEVLFEAMHTGHSVYATLHADTADQVLRRMTNPPINIPGILLEALHLVAVVYRDRRRGIRRVYQVAELVPSEKEGSFVHTNLLFLCRPNGEIVAKNQTDRVFEMLNMHTGMTRQEVKKDLKEKSRILGWIVKRNLNTVDDVGKIFSEYYASPELVLRAAATNKSPQAVIRAMP